MNIEKLKGTGVALVTPLKSDFSIDYHALKNVLDHVAEGGVEYLVVMGTTGESPTISWDEKMDILRFIIDNNKQGLPLVYGHGGNNTQLLIDQLEQLKDFKIDAILSASPYYSKPSQEGIYHHYKALADKSAFPVLLYNVPGRTASNIAAETTIRLSNHPNIIGTKEAAGDLIQCAKIHTNTSEDFLLLSGDDALSIPIISLGGSGVISVIANIQPKEFSEMVREAIKGNYEQARALNAQLLDGYELVGKEGNPVSVKTGMECLGLMSGTVRLPLYKGSEGLKKQFEEYLGQ